MAEEHLDSHLAAEPLDLGDYSSLSESMETTENFEALRQSIMSFNDGMTVSPHDVLLDRTISAPNSNALTNMTTPSMGDDDSPDVPASFECSPMFENQGVGNNTTWFPLFDNSELHIQNSSDQDASPFTDSFTSNDFAMARSASNTSAADSNKADLLRHRVSLSAGVNKSRRAVKALAPIDVDEQDSKAAKRAKNTMAARKSRQKKRDVEDGLRVALDAMTAERDHWKLMAIAHGAPMPERSHSS